MAPVQSSLGLPSFEHNMALKRNSSPCHQGLTPPDSPTKASATPQTTVKDLKHLFDVLKKVLLDFNVLEKGLFDLTIQEPPNTPVSQDQAPAGPDMARLKQLLVKLTRDEYPPIETSSADELAGEERLQVADGIDLNSPICTTPDDFKSFKNWASTVQFTKVTETHDWDKDACKYKIDQPTESSSCLDEYAEYVFVIRERVDRRSEEVISYIDIKSEGLRDILRDVLRDVRAVSLMEDKPSVERNVLFHFLPELDKCAESMTEDSGNELMHLSHLRLLIDHLKHEYTTTSQRLVSMLQHGHITYDLLWALFKPGSHVFATCFGTGEPRCVTFDAGEEATQDDEAFFKLECRFLDYDGVKFGEAGIFLRISKFRGSKPIETLEAFPLDHHPSQQQVRKDLIRRGHKFRQLAGSHTQHCNGSAFFMNKGKPLKLNINGRVAVDAALFLEMQPNYSRPRLHDLWAARKGGIHVFDIDMLSSTGREREKEKMKMGSADERELCENDFLIACPTVYCFSFDTKMFLECAVSALTEIQWSPESFEYLEIPSETKILLSSLTKARLGLVPAVPFDDVIDGKGRGLNILLHGPPGVGKTFTVEATSERFNLPLYSIPAGELAVDGGDPNALEQQLEHIFKIAKHFNAVLLLDEADAFMEQRTSYHGTHNRLVAVLLRKLEYYQGILFLTTNRKIQFDEAIMSRIHLTIKYDDLTGEFRREVWKSQLSRAKTVQGPASVGLNELQDLVKSPLNGREIKNLIAIAHALATVDGERVGYKHLELAAGSSESLQEKFGQESRFEGMYV